MTVTHKLFKILSGYDVANRRTDRRTDGRTDGRTDRRTDERHTIIRPKFYFGRIKMNYLFITLSNYIYNILNHKYITGYMCSPHTPGHAETGEAGRHHQDVEAQEGMWPQDGVDGLQTAGQVGTQQVGCRILVTPRTEQTTWQQVSAFTITATVQPAWTEIHLHVTATVQPAWTEIHLYVTATVQPAWTEIHLPVTATVQPAWTEIHLHITATVQPAQTEIQPSQTFQNYLHFYQSIPASFTVSNN